MRRYVLLVVSAALVASLVMVGGKPEPPRPASIDGYRVTYRIDDRAGRTRQVRTEVVAVRRPFDGRVEQRVRGEITSGRVTNRTHLWQLTEEGALLFGVRRPPGGPARDASYRSFLDAADDGVVRAIGGGTALGRPCTWFAMKEPPPRPLQQPTDASRVELCVDPAGIVLREVWVFNGRVARIIEATDLDAEAPSAATFLEGKDPSTEEVRQPEVEALTQIGFVVAENVEARGLAFELDVPKGWELARRTLAAFGAGDRGAPTQVATEAFRRGNDIAIVERSTGADLSPPWGPGEGTAVEIGSRGEGRLVYFADRVEVRLVSKLGFARIIAPDRDIAMRFARSIIAFA